MMAWLSQGHLKPVTSQEVCAPQQGVTCNASEDKANDLSMAGKYKEADFKDQKRSEGPEGGMLCVPAG